MTATQAADFLTRYTIVSHLANTASGFSATLMRDNVTGAYTLSMRSTEYFNEGQGGDWSRDGLSGADGEIGGVGFAFGQIASMESYYEHLKLGESYNVTTGLWESDPNLNDFKSKFGANPTGGVLNVTGYSLSGSLATLFTELHPEVTQACVLNAAGLGNLSPAKTLAQMVADFRQRLSDAGIDLSVPSNVNIYAAADVSDPTIKSEYQTIRDAVATEYGGIFGTRYTQGGVASLVDARITQLFGHGAHNDTEIVANGGIHVPATLLFIEDQPNLQGLGPISWLNWMLSAQSDYGTTHSITLVADSLAVMNVFEKLGLDTSTPQGLSTAYNLLAGGSNQLATGLILSNGIAESDSLEKAVEALGKLLLGEAPFAALAGGTTLPIGTQGGTFGNLDNRTKFYAVLNAINTAIASKTYVIEPLVGDYASTLLQIAEDQSQPQRAMAYRYALVNGNPFAVTGFDYSTINTAGELDLYNPVTEQGQLTEEYLKERAAFVERKIYYNLHDAKYDAGDSQVLGYNLSNPLNNGSTESDAYSNEDTLWDDRTTAIKIQRVSAVTADTRRITFGSGASEADIDGANAADALFGGAGNDTLKGGKGNDTLVGGKDYDTYILNAGDGFDAVLDSDGLGVIKFGSTAATGSAGLIDPTKWKQLGTDTWVDTQNNTAYSRYTENGNIQLLIHKGDSNVLVKDWADGELGIALGAGAAPTLPATVLTLTGDKKPLDTDLTKAGAQPGYDALHNLLTEATTEARQDILYGSTANDILLGDHELATVNSYDYTKNASLLASITHTPDGFGGLVHSYQLSIANTPSPAVGGNDIIDGGIGDDIVFAGGGDDQVDGGDGADVVFGDGGKDLIQGGIGNDILVGDNYGAGVPFDDDTLSGGDGNATTPFIGWICAMSKPNQSQNHRVISAYN